MTIDEAIAKYKFYHCIELQPGIFTPGWKEVVPLQAPVLEVIKEHDLRGKRVLDIGCRDGLFSFAAEKQGGLVLGIDNDLSKAATEFLIPLFQSSVIIKELNLYDFQVGPDERFDFVIFAGVLYHLRCPFFGMKRIADAMTAGGTMVLETALLLSHHSEPLLYCPRPEDSPYEPTSVSFFNHLGLVAGLQSFGFVDVECTSVYTPTHERFPSWPDFLDSKLASLCTSDDRLIGRGTYTCRYIRQAEAKMRDDYWFGSHRLHSPHA